MLLDTMINEQALIDAGISAQTILLGATEIGLGGCIIRTVNRSAVRQYYQLPDHLEIIQVIAIGKPQQTVELTSVQEDGSIEYFEDHSIHFVPKRSLEEIIFTLDKK
jgi:nitroreductase